MYNLENNTKTTYGLNWKDECKFILSEDEQVLKYLLNYLNSATTDQQCMLTSQHSN